MAVSFASLILPFFPLHIPAILWKAKIIQYLPLPIPYQIFYSEGGKSSFPGTQKKEFVLQYYLLPWERLRYWLFHIFSYPNTLINRCKHLCYVIPLLWGISKKFWCQDIRWYQSERGRILRPPSKDKRINTWKYSCNWKVNWKRRSFLPGETKKNWSFSFNFSLFNNSGRGKGFCWVFRVHCQNSF